MRIVTATPSSRIRASLKWPNEPVPAASYAFTAPSSHVSGGLNDEIAACPLRS